MRIAMLVATLRQCQVACDTVPALEGARHLLSSTSKEAQAMSIVKNTTRYSGVDRRAPRTEPGVLPAGTVAPRDLYKTGGRHGAITNTLYNWHSYKNWAEKIRGSWEEKK
jgi:hypothetical protein